MTGSRRLGSEEGIAVPMAIIVLAIVLALAAVAIMVATHGVQRSNRDRSSVRALQAAEAGFDVTAYRLNKTLVASSAMRGVTGFANDTIRTVGCVNANVSDTITFQQPTGNSWCAPITGVTESADIGTADDGTGEPATYRAWISTGVEVSISGTTYIERKIVAVGEVGDDVVRRVLGRVRSNLTLTDANITQVFQPVETVECTAVVPSNATPNADCPDLG